MNVSFNLKKKKSERKGRCYCVHCEGM